MKFPPSLLDDIRTRLPASQVVGRKVALKKSGREWRGLSPFKTEKTPSFYVNDQKGFYHCFASGEHGDIFKFLMTTEGLTFPEAVERLADEAGVPMPKAEARNPEREDERKRLYALMEASAKFFEASFNADGAAHARRYVIEKRGLRSDTIARFRLGYGPDSKNALKQHLAKLGFSNEDMIASGMLIGGADIPVSYDRFRNRVMFPIQDLKGRIIAFGGRALDPDAPAKYLNSPETPLFHKGHILFNAAGARAVAHKRDRIIAVEGYMDVVALAAAGFDESVAPLGTALTEDQVALLWRFADEPILCFDGDNAGRKAAHRAIDTGLPHLTPGKSLRFAFLPDGLDPDDLIRQQGAAAMETILGATRSLADVMFDREWASGDWSTPERRARFEQQIMTLVSRIKDDQVRAYYAEDMRERLNKAFGRTASTALTVPAQTLPERSGREPRSGYGDTRSAQVERRGGKMPMAWPPKAMAGGGRRAWQPPGLLDVPMPASESLRNNLQSGDMPAREALLLRTLLNHPWLLEERWEDVAGLMLTSGGAKRLRDTFLDLQASNTPLDSTGVRAHLKQLGLDAVLQHLDRTATHRGDRFAEPDADRGLVEAGWSHTLELHTRDMLRRALADAQIAWNEDDSEEAWARITEIKRLQARQLAMDDTSTL